MHKRGFTLIEMMVSVAIIAVISAIIVYNHSKFNSDLEITNVAYRVALEARQAQVYGISVQRSTDSSGSFQAAYGLHFNASQPASFIFYNTLDQSGKYSSGGGAGSDTTCTLPQCIEQVNLGHGNTIKKLCSIGTSGTSCTDTPSGFYALDILFKRPKPDAIANEYIGGNYLGTPVDQSAVAGWAICLASPQGREKRVVILTTGQISVENVNTAASPADMCAGA